MKNIPSIKELRKICQEPRLKNDAWYLRIFVRRVSVYFTKLFLSTPIIPNQVTILMILMGVIGGIFLGMPGYLNGLIGVLFLQLFLIFDCVDGEIARCRKIFSAEGKLLDLIANDIVFISIFSGLVFKIFTGNYKIFDISLSQNFIVVIIGFGTVVFFLLSKIFPQYAKDVDERLNYSYVKSVIFNAKFKPIVVQIVKNLALVPTVIVIVTVGAVFNIFPYVLFFYGIFFSLYGFALSMARLKNKGIK